MPKILANDGIHPLGKEILEKNGFEVDSEFIPQDQLQEKLPNYDGILVRSATKVRKDLIDACPDLKLIGRGGVGMDNIDVDYARSKGIKVINTPAASSQSVAELVFAHIFTGARFLHESNRIMPGEGDINFKEIKKRLSKGIELRGKNLGIIGFGRIGQAVARIGLGLGMHVLPFKLHHEDVKIEVDFFKIKDASVNIVVHCDPFEMILEESDFITLHVPFPPGAEPILYKERFDLMKDGVGIINTSRGGAIVEKDLVMALDSGKVGFAGLDVYENEPLPSKAILNHPKISLTPHTGASTVEAQTRVWIEMADQVVHYFQKEANSVAS
ncbi:MAG: D-2-hydroxyacid dehydrogenase [Bacteroidia bacterium]|nr:D-2-hydroxyacid dehydrogenase [Bacteroidia bacterium]